jgi:hypothetical protein
MSTDGLQWKDLHCDAPKQEQGRERLTRPKPSKALYILTGYLNIHSPHTADDVHREYDGTKHSKFSQDIGSLLLTLIHQDIDLR